MMRRAGATRGGATFGVIALATTSAILAAVSCGDDTTARDVARSHADPADTRAREPMDEPTDEVAHAPTDEVAHAPTDEVAHAPPRDPAQEPERAPPRLRCVVEAYPDAVARVDVAHGEVHLVDGRSARWDDGRDKSLDERIADPDLEDTIAEPYPAGAALDAVPAGVEPGRARHLALLEAAYGHDAREVSAALVDVAWPFQREPVAFQRKNGAADALRRVATRIADIAEASRACVTPTRGSFVWRDIRGTDRQSPHSFGIAVDLALACGDYWLWARPFDGRWKNRMPADVVHAFESERFVWGGRWHRYDTLHFEYRPELFAAGCAASPPGGPPASLQPNRPFPRSIHRETRDTP